MEAGANLPASSSMMNKTIKVSMDEDTVLARNESKDSHISVHR